jgi:predicted metal-dependent phosphoesterase TrpH
VVRVALDKGLQAIAITDHDTTDAVDQAVAAASGERLEVIPGIELSAEEGPREVHVLGYYIDHRDQTLQGRLAVLRRARRERAWKMVKKLETTGTPVSWERVVEIAGKTSAFGRLHIAQALLEGGYVASVNEAFNRYIGVRGPAYVSRYKLTPAEAVKMIADAEGLPVLAHPRGQEDVITTLSALGLVGLEAYYPSYSEEERKLLARLAARHNLVATGGSDFHGYNGGDASLSLGEVPVPLESLKRLPVVSSISSGVTSTVTSFFNSTVTVCFKAFSALTSPAP